MAGNLFLLLFFLFRSLATRHKYPVVFCHNDMQEGNILLRQNTRKPELVLIDFEYCSYNYRAFDIANHFVEWQYDYTAAEYPFFHERAGSGPTKEQKVSVGECYLSKHLQKEKRKKKKRKKRKKIMVRSSRFLILRSICLQLVLRPRRNKQTNYIHIRVPQRFLVTYSAFVIQSHFYSIARSISFQSIISTH